MTNRIFSLLGIAIVFTGCATHTKSVSSLEGSSFEKSVSEVLDGVLNTCAQTVNVEESLFNQDSISFEISADGTAKKGIAYRSPNQISKPWAYCVEGLVKETKFAAPPENRSYHFRTEVQWDNLIAKQPQLLTSRIGIKKAIKTNFSSMQTCYSEYVKKGGKQHGTLHLEIEILPDGKASSVHTKSESIDDVELLSCIRTSMEKVRFPSQKVKTTTTVFYPLRFENP